MRHIMFGSLVSSALVGIMAAGTASASDTSTTTTKAGEAKAARCVHSCGGYAKCKGNGNNSCAGKNSCADSGKVPTECSSVKTEEACIKVAGKKADEKMCTWKAS